MATASTMIETLDLVPHPDPSDQAGAVSDTPETDKTVDWEIIQRGDAGTKQPKLTDLYEKTTPKEVLDELGKIFDNITRQGRRDKTQYEKEKENDEARKEELGRILDRMKSLCSKIDSTDTGPKFSTPAPPQHILRSEEPVSGNQKRDPRVCTSTKEWKFDGYPAAWAGEKDTSPPRENYFWSVTDLLGLFFTKLGPAPQGADAETFFLPLTALYGRWTVSLMEKEIPGLSDSELKKFRPKPRKKKDHKYSARAPAPPAPEPSPARQPSMFQCTWTNPPEGKGEFASFSLGASSGGFNQQLAKRAFGVYLKKARFDLLHEIGTLSKATAQKTLQCPQDKKKTFEKTVEWGFGNPTPALWEFGNCAETYPFLQLLVKRAPDERNRTWGFALKNAAVQYDPEVADTHVYKEEYLLQTTEVKGQGTKGTEHKFIAPPCSNCDYLLYLTDAKAEQFSPAGLFNKPSANPVPGPSTSGPTHEGVNV